MATILIRTHPIKVYYVTGSDARQAREAADLEGIHLDGPCFTTESFGYDGFAWNTPEEFESDYAESFGGMQPAKESEITR